MSRYYAIGGVINLIGKRTWWGGIGIYDEKLKNKFLNQALYNQSPKNKKDRKRIETGAKQYTFTTNDKHRSGLKPIPRLEGIEQVLLFTNKDDAIIFSDLLKEIDRSEAIMKRAPVFEVEVNDDSLIFERKNFLELPGYGHIGGHRFNDKDNHSLLYKRDDHKLNCCVLKDKSLENFKKQSRTVASYLPGYHNLGDDKFHTRTLVEKANRKFFDLETKLVFIFTFWTVLIPIAYSLYRYILKSDAKKILDEGNDYHSYSPLWAEHDKKSLIQLDYSFQENKKTAKNKTKESNLDASKFIFDQFRKSTSSSIEVSPLLDDKEVKNVVTVNKFM